MSDIKDLRKDTNNTYSGFFCLHMLVPVVTKRAWRSLSCHKELSDPGFVSLSDEAFALLVLENNWDFWVAQAKDKEASMVDHPPLYTNDSKKVGKGKGWSELGRTRFNELGQQVVLDRQQDHAKAFEVAFLEAAKEKVTGKRKRAAAIQDSGDASSTYFFCDEMP